MSSKWSTAYLTGNQEIDEHHFMIIKKLYEIGKLIKLPHANSEIMDALLFLESYTQVHFRKEEALMDEIHCPVANENKYQHDVFIKYIHALNQKFAEGDLSGIILENIEKELSDWVISHILHIDLQLKKQELIE